MTVDVKLRIDVSDLKNEELLELFFQAQDELGYQGQWAVRAGIMRFIGALNRRDLGFWAEAIAAEALRQGVTQPTPPTPRQETGIIVTQLNDTEQALAESGRIIPAIRQLRARTSLGLEEAKDECDAWAENVRIRRVEQLMRVLASPPPTGHGLP